MRFMLIVKADKSSEAGELPSKELMTEMGKFNEEMAKAGVLLAGEGLQPTSKSARVKFSNGKQRVVQGPFKRPQDLVAGFWLIEAKSLEEAIEWAKRSPNPMGEGSEAEIEVRQIFEASDFPPEILSAEDVAREKALRESLGKGITRH